MQPPLTPGNPIRPRGAFTSGTIGCLVQDSDGEVFLVTCDHVVRTWACRRTGRVDLHRVVPPGHPRGAPVARFSGRSLALRRDGSADLAAARLLAPPPPDPARLPDGDRLTGLADVRPGLVVWCRGRSSQRRCRARVLPSRPPAFHPHPTLGPRRFALQTHLARVSGPPPELGDSGAPLVTASGRLVGFLSAGNLDHLVAVPARPALTALGVTLLLSPVPVEVHP